MSQTPPTLFEHQCYGQVLRTVSRATGVATDVIEGKSRRRRHVQARAAVCYRAYELEMSYPVIGSFLNRDHTSVRHLAIKYRKALANNEPWTLAMGAHR